MTRLERNVNIAAVVIPFLGLFASGVLLWNSLLGPRDLVLFLVMYLLTGFGITVGFHRLLTHRAFETHAWVRYLFAILGSMALEGSVIDWVADHRKHHTFPDEEGDPHSPHVHEGSGLKGMLHGLYHAHVGWLFSTHGQASSRRYARDLAEDPRMRRINRAFPWLALASLALPALLGFVISGGSWLAALTAYIWAGLARVFLVHHVTWSINSICHFFGRRRFELEDRSTNVFWLALPSLRRGLASQPPRVPALGVPRDALVRARPLGLDHRGDGEARPRVGRRACEQREAAREARRDDATFAALGARPPPQALRRTSSSRSAKARGTWNKRPIGPRGFHLAGKLAEAPV